MITDRWFDKSTWGDGPWQDEPDRADWVELRTGLPCLALRNEMFGSWCGYVLTPPGHPWHSKSYDDVPAVVHGGLTFAGPSMEPQRDRICLLGESDRGWWLGFDCHHHLDLSPVMARGWFRLGDEVYRTLDYVVDQCKGLAVQADAFAADPELYERWLAER